MMINDLCDLYDLQRVERHHEQFVDGEVACSRAVAALL